MELVENFDIKKIETIVKDDLNEKDISGLIHDDNSKSNEIMFIEGPPTMNGIPHAGHLRGRVFKDLWYSCLLYTSPSPRDKRQSRMPSSA